ncbi:MAG: Ser/Thr phosphatase [Frankiales bacterium]|nr:Ser/Thr phosphatase [Frankiales bacterium]
MSAARAAAPVGRPLTRDDLEALALEGALLGGLLDRAQHTPPDEVAAVVAELAESVGLGQVRLYLQDYDQQMLVALPVAGTALPEPLPVADSPAGRAFSTNRAQESAAPGGVQMWLPLLDGTDRVGVLGLVALDTSASTRRLARRLAAATAELLVTKGAYTDSFFRARRARATTLWAEMQWHLLPPLTMETSVVAVAGALEPAYEVGGDAFDYALNGAVLHLGIFDAMGHGLGAATMCAVAVGAYRHARRNGIALEDTYAAIDDALTTQFDDGHFATGQLADLDTATGVLRWVNAGHPRPLLVRGEKVLRSLRAEPTLPLGLGGDAPDIGIEHLEPGDRVLFFTDGVVEQLTSDGTEFGFTRLAERVEQEAATGASVAETTRRLSTTLLQHPGGLRDDATLLMVEWLRQPD